VETAKDVMTREVVTIRPDEPIRAMIERIRETSYSGLPVVDAQGRAVGLVSQNDVLRAITFVQGAGQLLETFQVGKRQAAVALLEAVREKRQAIAVHDFLERPVREIMSAHLVGCAPDTPLTEVCHAMVEGHVHRVVVLEDGKVIGLVSATDLVRELGALLAG